MERGRTPSSGCRATTSVTTSRSTYITDHYGIRNRHDIGVERILWSSDYPHVGADWPNSWRTIGADFSGIERAERDLILSGKRRAPVPVSAKVGGFAGGRRPALKVLLETPGRHLGGGWAATPARSAKTAALATLLGTVGRRRDRAGRGLAVRRTEQGKVGVGWATVFSVDVGHAAVPSLTIADLDRSIEDVSRSAGPGSSAVRQAGLAELLAGRPTTRPSSCAACSPVSCARGAGRRDDRRGRPRPPAGPGRGAPGRHAER